MNSHSSSISAPIFTDFATASIGSTYFPAGDGMLIGLIVCVMIGLIFVILMVLLIVIFLKRRKSNQISESLSLSQRFSSIIRLLIVWWTIHLSPTMIQSYPKIFISNKWVWFIKVTKYC
jgi:heme/copper-type cytochrome/quinol oxidase subunit 2